MRAAHSHGSFRPPGFTLVEVLVVVVVMAIGLLGGLELLLAGLRASRLAIQQTVATNLVADLGDRIRANRSAGIAYALDAGTLLPAPAKPCHSTDQCDAEDVAARDLYEWQQAALTSLPGATTSVQVGPDGGPSGKLYVIRIEWAEAGRSAGTRFTLTVQA
jgi:type IV pilus modification protein PilV